jgi:hypothetical protein
VKFAGALKRGATPTKAGLQDSDVWRTVRDAKNMLALHRSLCPCARKVDIGLFLVFGFGSASPTHRLLSVLLELISF